MKWTPPRDAYDPERFFSGDAIRDYLCTCSVTERNTLLLGIDLKQLRPYVILACLQITKGEPVGFLHRARERLKEIWGSEAKADELIEGALHVFRTAKAARVAWQNRRRDNN